MLEPVAGCDAPRQGVHRIGGEIVPQLLVGTAVGEDLVALRPMRQATIAGSVLPLQIALAPLRPIWATYRTLGALWLDRKLRGR